MVAGAPHSPNINPAIAGKVGLPVLIAPKCALFDRLAGISLVGRAVPLDFQLEDGAGEVVALDERAGGCR